MTNAARMKDQADVAELIKVRSLPEDFASQLDPYVRDKFGELWNLNRRRFIERIRDDRLTDGVSSWDALIARLPDHAPFLLQMRTDGVVIDTEHLATPGLAVLVCTDGEVAQRYDMHEESELWPDPEDVRGDAVD
jgi:hypothetical protein